MYPNLSGRYCALSGIHMTWDCSKPTNKRVLADSVKIQGKPLQLDQKYKVAMHSFMAVGGDGFNCFTECPLL